MIVPIKRRRLEDVKVLSSLLNDSGGLVYHWSAFRHRRNLWLPFISGIEKSLSEEWNPQSKSLIIFGPSAGWTLTREFLSRFEHVLCVEPDPVARLLFGRRFQVDDLKFESRANILPWFGGDLKSFLAETPDASVLFSNLLGQLPLLIPAKERTLSGEAKAQHRFLEALEGREWATYHDVLSSNTEPKRQAPIETKETDLEKLAGLYFDSGHSKTIIDHETAWLKASSFRPWRLTPDTTHIVGFRCERIKPTK